MDPLSQSTSFIPKKSVVDTTLNSGGKATNVVTLVCLALFVVAAIGAAGIFVFDRILEQQKESKQAELDKYNAELKEPIVKEIKTVDARLIAATSRLNNHIALSVFFSNLNQITLRNVQWKTLRFEQQGDSAHIVTFEGEAGSFASVALQAQEFSNSAFFVNPLVSNLNKTATGNASFALRASINPQAISYKEFIKQFEEVSEEIDAAEFSTSTDTAESDSEAVESESEAVNP